MKRAFLFLIVISHFFLHADEQLMQSEIKHVVILMLENRSFDNVLGWLYNNKEDVPSSFIPADADPHYLGLDEDTLGQFTNVLKNSKGEIVFDSPPIKGLPSVRHTKLINSPKVDPHEPFEHVTVQIFNGGSEPSMSGFLQDFATLWDEEDWKAQKKEICAVMETYTSKEMPLLNGLAKHYAVSDYYFSSIPTQTNPNRAFSVCGTSDGQVNNGYLGKNLFTSDTLWNRLSEESPNTTWNVFWQSDFIPFLYPGPLNGTNLFASLKRIPNLGEHYKKFDEFHALARKGQLPDISYLEPAWTLSVNVSPNEKEVLDAALRNEDLILGFQGNDCHPPGDVRTSENLVANIYTSLIANKEAWNSTLFIIVFDEHGGLFDHISPPAAVPPDNRNQDGFNFDRYGVRVPAIFISPRIAAKTVLRSDSSTPFDHASIIATILKWKQIDKSKWNLGNRVAIAPTFESVITLATPRTDKVVPNEEENVANANQNAVIHMGESFFIRDSEGKYLTRSPSFYKQAAHMGSKDHRVAYTFAGGEGKVTVGSFALICSCEKSLKDRNLLESTVFGDSCIFSLNNHKSNQWWSVKCVDNLCTGAKIHYEDRVYLENHTYLDPILYVPCRLSKRDGITGPSVTVVPITEEEAEKSFWFLEKAPT